MSRTIDHAADLEELHRATALANFQAARKQTAAVSAFECEECGDLIPEARRQAIIGCRCCVVCQERIERYGKA